MYWRCLGGLHDADYLQWRPMSVPLLVLVCMSIAMLLSPCVLCFVAVASLGGDGRTAPGDTIQGMTPEWKKMWLNLQRTLDNAMSEDVGCGQLKNVITLWRWLKRGREFFEGKIGVTPSVAVPGDTNPSDATELL